MDTITQDARFRQGAVKFSYGHTVTEAAIRYKTSERSIYRWRGRYDGTLESLKDKSRRHNGKVERQHRIDEMRFYNRLRMYNLTDGRKQMKNYNKKSNNISKSCLKYRTSNAVLQDYSDAMC